MDLHVEERGERLNAFEMLVWRSMERVSWKDRKSNEEVLKLVGERRSLLTTVVIRKKNWIGLVLRGSGDCLMRHVMEGGIEGVRLRGRPRDKMLDDLMEGSYQRMKRRAQDRKLWKVWMPRTCRETKH